MAFLLNRYAIFTDAEGISSDRWCWDTILIINRHLNDGGIKTRIADVTAMCKRTKRDVISEMTN